MNGNEPQRSNTQALPLAALGLAVAFVLTFVALQPEAAPQVAEQRPSPTTREGASVSDLSVTPAPAVQQTPSAKQSASARQALPAGDFDEQALMLMLRSAQGNDPQLAAELAREGNRRFPDSADAPERASILVHALAEQGLSSEARGAAEDMVNHQPDSHWVREVERFTGAHRHRNVRVDAEGKLRYSDPPPT